MVDWFNFAAFDIIGDLTLGESFNCLQDSKFHPWVSYLLVYFKSSSFLTVTKRYPIFAPLLMKFIPIEVLVWRFQHAAFTKEKVEKRMAMGNERGDFMSNILKHNQKEVGTGMTKEEIISTSSILLLAGSETTATALSAAIYYLSKFPPTMRKLKEEV
jgi:cytochrome P450